jgi:hypothetical protein
MNTTPERREYPTSLNGGEPQDDNEVRLGEENRRPLDPGRQDQAVDETPTAPKPRSADDHST